MGITVTPGKSRSERRTPAAPALPENVTPTGGAVLNGDL
jgi:hypothetical protein